MKDFFVVYEGLRHKIRFQRHLAGRCHLPQKQAYRLCRGQTITGEHLRRLMMDAVIYLNTDMRRAHNISLLINHDTYCKIAAKRVNHAVSRLQPL